jgi:hypothetical protein
MIKTIRKFFFKTVISYLRLKYFFKDTLKAGSPSDASNSSFLNTIQYFFKGLIIQLKSYFDNQLKTAIAFTGEDISQEALTYPQSIRLVLSYYLNLPVLQGYGKKTQVDKYSALDLSWFQTIQCFIEGLTLQITDYFNQKFDLTGFVLYTIENDYADDDKIINIMDTFRDEQDYLVAALITSTNQGSRKSVDFLLQNRVFHDSVLSSGLQNASRAGHAEIVKLFLAAGTRCMSEQTLILAAKKSLILARANHHEAIIKLILEQTDVNKKCTDAIPSSEWGRLMNYYRTAREMIDVATINSMFKNAVLANHQYMVPLMLDDQDVNQEEITDALGHAALSGFDNVLKLLLRKFPYNPQTYEQPRHKALSIASSEGHVGSVTILLQEITYPQAIKDALEYAQKNHRGEVVALLAAKQAALDKSENNQDGSETLQQQPHKGNTPSLGTGSRRFLPGSSVFLDPSQLRKGPPRAAFER